MIAVDAKERVQKLKSLCANVRQINVERVCRMRDSIPGGNELDSRVTSKECSRWESIREQHQSGGDCARKHDGEQGVVFMQPTALTPFALNAFRVVLHCARHRTILPRGRPRTDQVTSPREAFGKTFPEMDRTGRWENAKDSWTAR